MSQRRGSTVDCKWERHALEKSEFCFSSYNTVLCYNALDASDYDSNSNSITCESELHMDGGSLHIMGALKCLTQTQWFFEHFF